MMKTTTMKICLYAVMSICMLSCTKGNQPLPDIDYSFSLNSDPIPNQVYLQDGAIKIRLYVHRKDYTASTNYFFSHYITEGRGQLSKSTGNVNYEEGKEYSFWTSPTKDKDTLEFKYFPSFSPPTSYSVPTTINFIVKNKAYADTLVYQTDIYTSKR